MKMRKSNKKAGFTLVELMVVAIIVAILAAVAIPLMSANKTRAAATEAEAGLGTMRSALRAMYAETDSYIVKPGGGALGTGSATNIPGMRPSDLNGKYFQDGNYSITAIAATTYTLQATGSTNALVSGVTITLNQAGDFTRAGL
jgi:prepilin-type N-terminal cleavage/methylation domain-containing protein